MTVSRVPNLLIDLDCYCPGSSAIGNLGGCTAIQLNGPGINKGSIIIDLIGRSLDHVPITRFSRVGYGEYTAPIGTCTAYREAGAIQPLRIVLLTRQGPHRGYRLCYCLGCCRSDSYGWGRFRGGSACDTRSQEWCDGYSRLNRP